MKSESRKVSIKDIMTEGFDVVSILELSDNLGIIAKESPNAKIAYEKSKSAFECFNFIVLGQLFNQFHDEMVEANPTKEEAKSHFLAFRVLLGETFGENIRFENISDEELEEHDAVVGAQVFWKDEELMTTVIPKAIVSDGEKEPEEQVDTLKAFFEACVEFGGDWEKAYEKVPAVDEKTLRFLEDIESVLGKNPKAIVGAAKKVLAQMEASND